MMQRTRRRLARTAFTLMEMLVVVAIIVALAGIGGYYYLQRVDEAKKQVAAQQTKVLTQAVQTYKIDHGDYPASLEALLVRSDEGKGPWLDSADALIDPWGRPYQYDPAGSNNGGLKPDIWSEGPEGQIGNWMARR